MLHDVSDGGTDFVGLFGASVSHPPGPVSQPTTRSGGLSHSWVALENNKPILFAINSNCAFEINASALFFSSSQHIKNQDLRLNTWLKKKNCNIIKSN